MIAEHFLRVLDAAAGYSQTQNEAMSIRDEGLKDARHALEVAIAAEHTVGPALSVHAGGRQSNYSPVPWIRIYSPDRAPSAHDGYYLVYLFAADGSRVYLSLQQGTSELRANAMRPIRDRTRVQQRAADGRQLLENVSDLPTGSRSTITVDLAKQSVEDVVGHESLLRIRNYEDVSSWAWQYSRQSLQSDEELLADLAVAIPALIAMYRLPEEPGSGGGPTAGTAKPVPGQGRESDPKVRLALERHAEDLAEADLKAKGWQVARVGHLHRGYDLECRRGSEQLHVEVKGTQSTGEEVKLTRNEVHHADDGCPAGHALFVASRVHVGPAPHYACTGASKSWSVPWQPDHDHLTVTEYRYRVPPGRATL